ncbi:MAG: hypothetical protein J6B37_05495 [Clostridia bacterium]|nr:hypothetical protein [Clostridia bacterium]
MKKYEKVYKIVSIVLSALLCVALAFSLFGATIISVGRDYLSSEKFDAQIESTDLSSLTFSHNGEEITLDKFVKDYLSNNIEGQINDSILGGIANLLNPFAGQITDFVVDQTLSSTQVNKAVKTQIHSIVNYLLHSDADAAKERIEKGITLDTNPEFDSDNAPTYEEKVNIEVKKAVFQYIESESGYSIDQIIIFISENTVKTLKTISAILAIVILLLNLPQSWYALLYFGLALNGYSAIMYVMEYRFNEMYKEMGNLVSYQFLKPIMDAYLPYGEKAFIYGMVALVVGVVLIVGIKVISDKKEQKNKSQG